MSRHAKHLRPLKETFGPHGQFTSETARRLLSVRGGRARAAQLKAINYEPLIRGRAKSILVRKAKALLKQTCLGCRSLGENINRQLAILAATQQHQDKPLDATDLRKLL